MVKASADGCSTDIGLERVVSKGKPHGCVYSHFDKVGGDRSVCMSVWG